jgi:hypothetical protein
MNSLRVANEEGHRVGWDEARILEIESNSRYRKYKESAHMAANPVWEFSHLDPPYQGRGYKLTEKIYVT